MLVSFFYLESQFVWEFIPVCNWVSWVLNVKKADRTLVRKMDQSIKLSIIFSLQACKNEVSFVCSTNCFLNIFSVLNSSQTLFFWYYLPVCSIYDDAAWNVIWSSVADIRTCFMFGMLIYQLKIKLVHLLEQICVVNGWKYYANNILGFEFTYELLCPSFCGSERFDS